MDFTQLQNNSIVLTIAIFIIFNEYTHIRIELLFIKILSINFLFRKEFLFPINKWETFYAPILYSIFKFALALLGGYYAPIILKGIIYHYFSFDISPYISTNITDINILSHYLLFVLLFYLSVFIVEAEYGTPLTRRIIEDIRKSMKEMSFSKTDNIADRLSVRKKIDLIVSEFYKAQGMKEQINIRGKVDAYYEEKILHDVMYERLTKIYYGQGAGFIVAFFYGANAATSLFIVLIPAYFLSSIMRYFTFRRTRELQTLYHDFAIDILSKYPEVNPNIFKILGN
ncbi:MAG: hypothetical protein D3925_01960 [Candidatus Electrothrix sp. AR5]|nr:hypothetical protein [Candidatus Electrothrix sp. AR5]